MTTLPLLDDAFLASHWHREYEAFYDSPEEYALLERLRAWNAREVLKETSSEAAFIRHFFVDIWGYVDQGSDGSGAYTCRPQFEVERAGQTGGQGSADLALGNFGPGRDAIPQVLCEFKDVRSGLDARQNRKGNTRSPVDQAFDYLHEAHSSRDRDALVTPSWAIVTDMREFRLYSRLKGKAVFQSFVLTESSDTRTPSLLGDSPAARFRRFVFQRMFQPGMLLAERGESALGHLLREQVTREKVIEKRFYLEYRSFRETVYDAIREANPEFTGTRGKLVRLTQRFLDRCIFILFCEDMGHTLRYPPELLRDLLIEVGNSKYYNPNDNAGWDHMKRLFAAMRDGGHFGDHPISRFNGGLFEADPELEELRIPTRVFCARNQGAQGAASLAEHPNTLLYFSAIYNFGHRDGSGERVIGLYTLGRIFEQSITELEIMEAEADERVSINKLSKRKTDGVYYTPEWVTHYIVENTVGARMADIKSELGYFDLPPIDEEALAEHRAFLKDKRRTARVAGLHLDFLRNYRQRISTLRVVDPACGSGAFLIQALNRLVAEFRWITAEEERIDGHASLWDQDEVIRSILSENIYGVDINPESVEITKLALWLHTAAPGRPLCALDRNILCGNSLVGPNFYDNPQVELFDENERERVNVFDWRAAFPVVFSHGGFDCVIGNPPYIKFQHFRKAQPEVAAYISACYRSAGAGNWDMYLPFIEKGLGLLHPDGRMGYIAPSVWMVNDYGSELRGLVKEKGALDRWLDFKSFQVFSEATTYTSIQFFSGKPCTQIACAAAPDGNIARTLWQADSCVRYEDLHNSKAWHLISASDRETLERIAKAGQPLEYLCDEIIVGVQTSADDIYYLRRVSPGRFATRAGQEVDLEEDLMRPIVSGADVRKFHKPRTDTYILYPYRVGDGRAALIPPTVMERTYPQAWAYLTANEQQLRSREHSKFDDESWYRFGRSQNIAKQHLPKLLVPRLVQNLFCAIDLQGAVVMDNVDVGGILPLRSADLPFLAAVINSAPANFYWRTTSRPFRNDTRAANKQFIAPIPIPNATPAQRENVGALATELQDLYSSRRNLIDKLNARLNSGQMEDFVPRLGPDWIWPNVGTAKSFLGHPGDLRGLALRQAKACARERHEKLLSAELDLLSTLLRPGAVLRVENTEDELFLDIDGRRAIELYDKPDIPFIAAQWRHTLRDRNVTEAYDGGRLLRDLLRLRTSREVELRSRIVQIDQEVANMDQEIARREHDLNEIVCALYSVSPEECQVNQ